MDLSTAVFRIAAREAAKREREGLRITEKPNPSLLEKLKEECPQLFVSGAVQATGHKFAKPFPVRTNRRNSAIVRAIMRPAVIPLPATSP